MADFKPPTIVREDMHIVKHWTPNEYDDILVTVAEQADPIKIGKKRAKLAEKLVANTQFNFKYANYMNKDYVADIECMESAEAVAEKPKNIPKTQEAPGAGQARGMCVKELGDMIRSGKLKEVFGEQNAVNLMAWYRNEVFGITQVAHDGAELPNPKTADRYTKEMLKNLMDAAIWDASQVATYINDTYGVKISSASKMFESLSNEQKKATLEHMDKNPKLPIEPEDLKF